MLHRIALLLVMGSNLGLAALVAVDQVFYFDLASCPANFAVLDGLNNGLLFLGDGATSTAGFTNGKSLFSPATDKTHTHTGSPAISGSFGGVSGNSGGSNGDILDNTGIGLSALGSVPSSASNFPFVQLLACKVTAANNMQVPLGLVTMMDPKTTTASAIKTCSAGFVDFAQANGRFVVATSTAQPSPNFATANPTPAYAPSVTDIPSHTHTLSATFSLAGGQGCGTIGGATWLNPDTYTISGPSSASSLDLPYRVTKMCKASTDLTPSAPTTPQLPLGAIAFFAAASCPMLNWVPADTKYNGRLIVSLPSGGSNGQTFGGSTLLQPGSTGIAHSHGAWTDATIKFDDGWSFGTSGSRCVKESPNPRSVGTGTSAETTVLIPTVTVLLCRRTDPTPSPTLRPTTSPTHLPTKSPTKQPTTLQPTKSPSRSPTTSFPSMDPTPAPTKLPTTGTPTHKPSKSPTGTRSPTTPTVEAPTLRPSTSPSTSPTTSEPTSAPTTSVPTASPTNRPLELNMCTTSDKAVFVDYDNYFNYQASSCAAECKSALIAKVQSNIEFCTAKCRAFVSYSKLCTKCFTNFLSCQSQNCNLCFVNGAPFVAQACKTCATNTCRAQLAECGGFPDTVLSIPTSAPIDFEGIAQAAENANQISIIVGATVGGAAFLLAVVLLVRRRSLNKRAEQEKDEVAHKIFKNKDVFAVTAPSRGMGEEFNNPMFSSKANADGEMRVPLRTRYSFHGDEIDELDVKAGVALLGISRNEQWWIALDESTSRVGVIPISYVSEV